MIVSTEYEKTPAHAKEMIACAEMTKADPFWQKDNLDTFATPEQYCKGYFSSAPGYEFARATEGINSGPPLRILDVGAGRGHTSIYLANHGHIVFPVEPSYDFCQIIEYMAQKFDKPLTIYQCSAEHLDIEEEQFDVVIFNVSLHHCDDPVLALKNMYRFLLPGGKLFVIDEPMLPFFRKMSEVQQDMASRPEVYGDYGGNEHIYHFGEYLSMIRQANFRDVKTEIIARYRSRDVISMSVADFPHWGGPRTIAKNIYLHIICSLIRARMKPILAIIKRLSLVQVTFSAVK
jgi:SAM-dependent methyltransferase